LREHDLRTADFALRVIGRRYFFCSSGFFMPGAEGPAPVVVLAPMAAPDEEPDPVTARLWASPGYGVEVPASVPDGTGCLSSCLGFC